MAAQDSVRTTGFPCKQCGTICPNMPSLLEHMDAHFEQEEERKFKCDICGRGYRHAGSLANHKKTHQVGSFQCNVCGKEHSNALALKSHLRIHTYQKKHSCTECGKAFRLATQLATHAKVHFKWEKEQTSRKADTDSPAHDHAGLEAFAEQPAALGSPAEESVEAAQLEDSVDTTDRPYRCDLCDKSYIHHRSLTNHKKTHQVGMFECTVCYKLFSNMSALYNHQRTHKAKGDAGLPPGSHAAVAASAEHFSPQTQDVQVNFCHLCQVLFLTDVEFQEHIQMHNSSSSMSFGLHDGLSENRHLAYDSGVVSPEQPNFYSSPTNNVPSVSSVDSYTGFDLPDQPISGGGLFSDCADGLPPPCNSTQGEPSVTDLGTLGPAHAPHHQPHPQAAAAGEEADDERPFRCNICGKSYRHSGSLINHKRSHQVGIYQCSVCRKSYPHLAALKSHLRLHRAQPSSFSLAPDGDWLSPEPQTLDSQQGSCSAQTGGVEAGSPRSGFGSKQENGSAYSNGTSYDEHYHHNDLNQHAFSPGVTADLPQNDATMQRHMCADCGDTFQDIAGIKSHSCPLLLLQHHDGFDGSTAPASDVDFCRLNGHSDQTYFQQSFHDGADGEQLNGGPLLENDGVGAEEEDEEEEDEDDDEDGDLYQCSICGNSYTNMRALRSHLRGHTQSQCTPVSSGPSSMSSHADLRDDEFGEMIICSTCGESFSSRQDLVAHQLLHNQEQQQQQQVDDSASLEFNASPMKSSPPGPRLQSESQSIICGGCGIFCSSYHHLENHGCSGAVKDEEKPEGEANSGALQEDVSRVGETDDGEQRQFRCEQCGRTYRHAGSLLNHKKSHKTGVFKCLVCQKRFYNLLALKNHQRSHFDVKRHTCPECGKAFKIQKQLLNHLRRHKENQAKIQELNTQIQALMQMNGSRLEEEEQPSIPNSSQKLKLHGRYTQQQQQQQQQQQHHGLKVEETECEADERPFSCDQCGRTYRHAGSLVNHRNSHKTGEYCCSVCSNTYSNQLAMKNHLRTHFANKKHSCPKCGKGFRGRKQLLAHNCVPHRKNRAAGRRLLKSRALRCRRCKQAFASTEQLAAHACGDPPPASAGGDDKQAGPEEERPFKCNLCSRSYRHAGSLLNHKNTHKTGHFSCTFCSKPFTNPMALRNHTRIHTQQKKYVCLTCGKAFRLASILHNHQRVHSRPAAHLACPACGKSFQGRSGLKRHRCFRGRGSSRGGEQRGHTAEKCFTCDLCGRSYRHAGSLLNHKKSHSESLHQCTLCLQTFPDPVTLQMHSGMTRHCCPECGKTFCLVAHLQSHMDVHARERSAPTGRGYQEAHDGAPDPYQHHQRGGDGAICWDSDLGLTGGPEPPPLSHLPDGFPNLEGSASEEKSHVCEHCGRTYRHAGSLLNHKYSHRTGSFTCAMCHKEFTNLMALRNHRRIHTEPKRYQCQDCGKAFRVSTQLICHRRIHTKEKPFGCPLCSKSFSSKSNLRHHQKMHAGGGAAVAAYDPAAFCADAADSFIDDLDMDAFL